MKEIIEFRIPESLASRYLPDDCGTRLTIVRRVELEPSDPMFELIGRVDRQMRADEGRSFITAWIPHRSYSKSELSGAELLRVAFTRVFEPAGEECGTMYDDKRACASCGAGAPQVTSLMLDGRKIPRKGDFARTIAGELVASRRVVEVFEREAMRGARFEPVRLADRRGEPSDQWYQLQVVARPVDVDAKTRVGRNPFDLANDRPDGCPRGDVLGLNLLSELHVVRTSLDDADITRTRQFFGVRRGLLRPEPEVLVSQRLWATIEEERLKGLRVEVVRLV